MPGLRQGLSLSARSGKRLARGEKQGRRGAAYLVDIDLRQGLARLLVYGDSVDIDLGRRNRGLIGWSLCELLVLLGGALGGRLGRGRSLRDVSYFAVARLAKKAVSRAPNL